VHLARGLLFANRGGSYKQRRWRCATKTRRTADRTAAAAAAAAAAGVYIYSFSAQKSSSHQLPQPREVKGVYSDKKSLIKKNKIIILFKKKSIGYLNKI